MPSLSITSKKYVIVYTNNPQKSVGKTTEITTTIEKSIYKYDYYAFVVLFSETIRRGRHNFFCRYFGPPFYIFNSFVQGKRVFPSYEGRLDFTGNKRRT
jgi:hypothetical protein